MRRWWSWIWETYHWYEVSVLEEIIKRTKVLWGMCKILHVLRGGRERDGTPLATPSIKRLFISTSMWHHLCLCPPPIWPPIHAQVLIKRPHPQLSTTGIRIRWKAIGLSFFINFQWNVMKMFSWNILFTPPDARFIVSEVFSPCGDHHILHTYIANSLNDDISIRNSKFWFWCYFHSDQSWYSCFQEGGEGGWTLQSFAKWHLDTHKRIIVTPAHNCHTNAWLSHKHPSDTPRCHTTRK